MRDPQLLVLVPSRGRPESVVRVVQAWIDTDAYDVAELCFVIDRDDPKYAGYFGCASELPNLGHTVVSFVTMDHWEPMVPKLNRVASQAADSWQYLAFMGDDHLPRTKGWAQAYAAQLAGMGTGIVSCPDGLRADDLPTQWAMTADIVRALGKMVPPAVDHLYCDNAIRDLGVLAECGAWLPELLIEHMHPLAGKADPDDGYVKVNSAERYRLDREAYLEWRHAGLRQDALKIMKLKGDPRGE